MWVSGPMTLPSPIDVAPRRITFGSRVTSAASVTSQSRYTVDGSRIVTPSRMCSSFRRTRRFHSAAASCERSLMPSNRPSSSNATAMTRRPSSRATRTSSVRYSSPVVADGSSDPMRRLSHSASNAYRPALISLFASSSSVASLASTIDSTEDELANNEINAGLYAFDAEWLRRRIGSLEPSATTGELYLTELVRVAREDGRLVIAVAFEDDGRFDGINDRSQL